MVNPNPATPAAPATATPGSGEHGSNQPSVVPAAPATPAPGNNNEGTVTIPVKEYRDLQRNDARARSFGKRIYQRPASTAAMNGDPNDPAAPERARADAAERRAMQLEVKGKVQDLLADDRFKSIPQSTKKLILEAPHMLSEAETLDDAMYDIEDKLIEIAASDNIPVTIKTDDTPPANNQPANRETPPIVTPGTPAPTDTTAMEDTSMLRGNARSQAALRNAFKKGGVNGMKPAQQ